MFDKKIHQHFILPFYYNNQKNLLIRMVNIECMFDGDGSLFYTVAWIPGNPLKFLENWIISITMVCIVFQNPTRIPLLTVAVTFVQYDKKKSMQWIASFLSLQKQKISIKNLFFFSLHKTHIIPNQYLLQFLNAFHRKISHLVRLMSVTLHTFRRNALL